MAQRFYTTASLLMVIGVASVTDAHTADEVLRKPRLKGQVISVEGFVRFDRLSQRGFLYPDLSDMRHRNYRKTIFLELGNEGFSSLKIPDGSYVVATGYLSKDLRGPLGVYPAHIIVDRVKVLRKNTAVGAHSVERVRPRLNFVVQHLLGLKEALIGCFVAMSFSWSVVEVFGD